MDNFNSVIDQDWSELSLDDGFIVDEYSEYYARLFPRDSSPANSFTTEIDNISYSPKVNSAPTLSVDVEDREVLERGRLFATSDTAYSPFLFGIIDVYVDDEVLFSGKITKIDTHQNDDGFYSVTAQSPGHRLVDQTINTTTDNEIISDFIAKTIDKYNNWHQDFNNIPKDKETLTDMDKVDDTIRKATSSSAEAEYFILKGDKPPSDIERIYFKVDSSDVTLEIREPVTGNTITSKNFTGLDSSDFGEWGAWDVDISDQGLDSYRIYFSFQDNDSLFDWLSLSELTVKRNVDPINPSTVATDERVQFLDTVSDFEDSVDISDNEPISAQNYGLEVLQTAHLSEPEVTDIDNVDFVNGRGERSLVGLRSSNFTIDLDYTIPNKHIGVAMRGIEQRDAFVNIEIDGLGTIDGTMDSILDWYTFGVGDTLGDLSPGVIDIDAYVEETPSQNNPRVDFDILCIYDKRYHDASNFDNTVHQNDGHLDSPNLYPDSFSVTFGEVSTSNVITKGYIDATVTSDSSSSTPNSVGISFTSGDSFSRSNSTSSDNFDNPSITSSIIGEIDFTNTSPNGTRNATPRTGYDGQKADSLELSVDTSNISLLFNEDISGNRLEVISNLADNSNTYFRWEGSSCEIFQRGSRSTSPDLREETVSSSVDAQDVYSSAEVIGDGVESGIVEADDSPSFIQRHKLIETDDIDNKKDAQRRARDFLNNNSTIVYRGDIETLPTLAPVGEKIDGGLFNHGQDMVIESVDYSKRRSSISLGREKSLQKEILDIERE
jgi:hypothetical protein